VRALHIIAALALFALTTGSCNARKNIVRPSQIDIVGSKNMDFAILLSKLASMRPSDILDKANFEKILGAQFARPPENLELHPRFDFTMDLEGEPIYYSYYSDKDTLDQSQRGHSFSIIIKNTQILKSPKQYCVSAIQAKMIWKSAGWKNAFDSPETDINNKSNKFDTFESFGKASFRYEKNGIRVHFRVQNYILPEIFTNENKNCVVDLYISDLLDKSKG
jgi:hypothetical protein